QVARLHVQQEADGAAALLIHQADVQGRPDAGAHVARGAVAQVRHVARHDVRAERVEVRTGVQRDVGLHPLDDLLASYAASKASSRSRGRNTRSAAASYCGSRMPGLLLPPSTSKSEWNSEYRCVGKRLRLHASTYMSKLRPPSSVSLLMRSTITL